MKFIERGNPIYLRKCNLSFFQIFTQSKHSERTMLRKNSLKIYDFYNINVNHHLGNSIGDHFSDFEEMVQKKKRIGSDPRTQLTIL